MKLSWCYVIMFITDSEKFSLAMGMLVTGTDEFWIFESNVGIYGLIRLSYRNVIRPIKESDCRPDLLFMLMIQKCTMTRPIKFTQLQSTFSTLWVATGSGCAILCYFKVTSDATNLIHTVYLHILLGLTT